MNCPRCQLYIVDPGETFCPRCGLALQPPQADVPTTASGGTEAPYAPPMYPGPLSQPMPSGSFPGYGAPPSGSLYGGGMPPSYPPYPVYLPYGVAAPGTTPLNMQPPWAPPMPPKRRNSALVGLLIALIVAVVAGSGVLVYLVAAGQHNPSGPQGATASATNTAAATSNYSIVFQDPLTSNANGWSNDSYCHFSSDGYHVTNRICYAPAGTFTDFALSVQTTQVSGINREFYGVVFRRVSTGNYYAFQIDSNGKWRVIKVANNHGSELVPYVPNAAIHQGLHVQNTLAVRASGMHFEFTVNDTKVGQVDDATYASGKCGFEVYQGIEVAYTNLAISVPNS